MTRFLRRALCAAAGVLALAGATQAGAATFEPLQSPSFGPIPDARVSQETASVALLGDVDLGVGSKVDLVTAPVDPAHAHAFDGLFLAASSAGMPYAALANGGISPASARLCRAICVSVPACKAPPPARPPSRPMSHRRSR